MIQIGRSRIETRDGRTRLRAEVSVDSRRLTLWFSVDAAQGRSLAPGRADPFVLALFPAALGEGHEIVCEDPLSERLCYQLGAYLAPILTAEREGLSPEPVKITAPLTSERHPSAGAAGIGFSRGEAFLPAVRRHGAGSEYPLTHVVAVNIQGGRDERPPEALRETRFSAKRFAEEQRLQALLLDTNLGAVLPESMEEAPVYGELACALALQGLLSVYLLSPEERSAPADPARRAVWELLACGCASSETVAVYPAATALAREEEPGGGPERRDACIRVGAPYLEEDGEETRLCARVSLRGEETVLWFSVKSEYAPGLVTDRADAFAAALLTTAMREGRDIVCAAPVTRRLLYQLNRLLIPIMASNMEEYHPIRIHAEATGAENCAAAVGTGWTGGVDSLFTVTEDLRGENPAYRLTHLMIASNGAIEGDDPSDTLRKMGEKAERGIVPELGLDLVCVDSNLRTALQESFRATVSIRHAAVVLALQGLFKAYFVSSSIACINSSFFSESMGYYEFLVLLCLGTDRTAFYSTGCAFTRLGKLRRLSESPLARRYLHPCIYALRDNCGECGKCVRTQLELYALGQLDCFSEVFDVERFQRTRNLCLADAILGRRRSPFNAEILEACRKNGISLWGAKLRIPGLMLRKVLTRIKSMLPKRK